MALRMFGMLLASVMLLASRVASSQVLEGMYTLRNANSGKYLSLAGDSTADGTSVQIGDDPSDGAARWRLRWLADGSAATLQSVSSGKYLSVSSANRGAIAQVRSDPSSPQSQWVVHEVSNGDGTSFTLKNVMSGFFLNVAGGSTSSGAKVHMWSNPGSSHSQWEFSGDEFCHDASPGESCYNDTLWATEYGMGARPEWYPGLSINSSFADVQAHLHYCYWNRSQYRVCTQCSTIARWPIAIGMRARVKMQLLAPSATSLWIGQCSTGSTQTQTGILVWTKRQMPGNFKRVCTRRNWLALRRMVAMSLVVMIRFQGSCATRRQHGLCSTASTIQRRALCIHHP
jgi:hypothetical protein